MSNARARILTLVVCVAMIAGTAGAIGYVTRDSGDVPTAADPQPPVVEDPGTPIPSDPPQPAAAGSARVVFAGDLATGGGCADHATDDACDLFEATVDLATGEVSNVRQLTDTAVSESYPAWNPNGSTAYYTVLRTAKSKDLGYVNVASGTVGTLVADASWPEVGPAGNLLLYVAGKTKKIMRAALGTDGISLGATTELTGVANQQDPDFSPDGTAVAFHETGGGEGVAAVLDLATGATASYGTRAGHCAFAPSGTRTVCDSVSSGGLVSRAYADGKLGEQSLYVADQRPGTLDDFDPSLASCAGTSFNYPTFCGDDRHLIVSTSCNVGGSVSFSRLFLIDLTGDAPAYRPLGLNLASAYGGPGMSTWTADCLVE